MILIHAALIIVNGLSENANILIAKEKISISDWFTGSPSTAIIPAFDLISK